MPPSYRSIDTERVRTMASTIDLRATAADDLIMTIQRARELAGLSGSHTAPFATSLADLDDLTARLRWACDAVDDDARSGLSLPHPSPAVVGTANSAIGQLADQSADPRLDLIGAGDPDGAMSTWAPRIARTTEVVGAGFDFAESYRLYDDGTRSGPEVATVATLRTASAWAGATAAASVGCQVGVAAGGWAGPPGAAVGCLVGGTAAGIAGSGLAKTAFDTGVDEVEPIIDATADAIDDATEDFFRGISQPPRFGG